MTTPTKSVSVRRTEYNNELLASGSVTPVLYDDPYDGYQNLDVLDATLKYNPLIVLNGYRWDGLQQVPIGGGDSAPTFNPLTDVTTGVPVIWAESDFGKYQDVEKTIPATANNDVVKAWVDQVAGHDFLQATIDNAFINKTNVVGTMPGLLLDGIDDFLRTVAFDSLIGVGGYTLFLSLITNNDGTNRSPFAMNTTGGLGSEFYLLSTASVIYQYGGAYRAYSGSLDANPHVVCFRRPADESGRTRLYIDGVLDSEDSATNLDSESWGNHPLTLGNAGTSDFPFSGYYFGIGLFKGTLSDADMLATVDYLKKKLAGL